MKTLRPCLLILGLLISLVCWTTAIQADPISVTTYHREFINWATPHEDTFTFPPAQLYSQILCHIDISCPAAPADCDPWDRFANLKVKRPTGPDTFESLEIARFITPYDITFNGGPQDCAWTTDVTDYQFLLHDDVDLSLYIESWMGNENGWIVSVRFEMTPGEPELEPFAVQKLWSSGNVQYGNPENPWEDQLLPMTVNVPAVATSARVRNYTTGHGFWNTDNAAEFSIKWQRVVIDGNNTQRYIWRSNCAVNPCGPQQGTWQYNRAGWCPGDIVVPWSFDITPWLDPGGTHDFGYMLQPYENDCRPNNPACVDADGCDCSGHAYYKLESQVIFYRVPNSATGLNGELIPGKLHLVGNYPNPFNPETTIRYHIAEAGPVVINVYDAQGNHVRREQANHTASGQYAWTWNGRNRQGDLMPSSVYIYEVSYGQETVSAKMTLLK